MDRLLSTWNCFPTISWGDIPEMSADQSHHPRQWRHPMLPSIKWDIVKYSVCIPLVPCSALVQLPLPCASYLLQTQLGKDAWDHYSLEKKRQVPNYLSSLRGKLSQVTGYHLSHTPNSGTTFNPRRGSALLPKSPATNLLTLEMCMANRFCIWAYTFCTQPQDLASPPIVFSVFPSLVCSESSLSSILW